MQLPRRNLRARERTREVPASQIDKDVLQLGEFRDGYGVMLEKSMWYYVVAQEGGGHPPVQIETFTNLRDAVGFCHALRAASRYGYARGRNGPAFQALDGGHLFNANDGRMPVPKYPRGAEPLAVDAFGVFVDLHCPRPNYE